MRRDGDTEMGTLANDMNRLRRRASRQKRSIGSRPEAWRDWSATMDEIVALTLRLVSSC